MTHINIFRIRLPLILRVVALYAVLALPVWYGASSARPAVASVRPAQTIDPASYVRFQKDTLISGKPIRIHIPRIGINLSIIEGDYDPRANAWTLTEDKAQFARMTDMANNESGNTFIYGHNTAAVFAPLASLKAGDKAIITTSNGRNFTYVFNGQKLVNPDTTSILATSQKPIMTLMTCEGIFSEARRVAIFDFKDVL